MKLHKKAILFLSFFIAHQSITKAQSFEVGVMLGSTYYYGDVNNDFRISIPQFRYSALGFFKIPISSRFSARTNIVYARIIGLDSLSSSNYQKKRNLNFFSDIYELSGVIEYNLLPDYMADKRPKNRYVPYLFGGIGGFYFIPKTYYNGSVYNLKNYNTAGEDYSQIAVCFPLGVGVRYYISNHFRLGFEFGARFTNTSYLDDIPGRTSTWQDPNTITDPLKYRITFGNEITSTNRRQPGGLRGKLTTNDIYYLFGITLSYINHPYYKKGRSGQGCPRFY